MVTYSSRSEERRIALDLSVFIINETLVILVILVKLRRRIDSVLKLRFGVLGTKLACMLASKRSSGIIGLSAIGNTRSTTIHLPLILSNCHLIGIVDLVELKLSAPP